MSRLDARSHDFPLVLGEFILAFHSYTPADVPAIVLNNPPPNFYRDDRSNLVTHKNCPEASIVMPYPNEADTLGSCIVERASGLVKEDLATNSAAAYRK